MQFCGCLSCCGKEVDQEDSGGIEREVFVNRGFETDREEAPSEDEKNKLTNSKEAYVWGGVLEELKRKFEILNNPEDDVLPNKSMAWVFKFLKPVDTKEVQQKMNSELSEFHSVYLGVFKITDKAQNRPNRKKETKTMMPETSIETTETMSNVVPSIGKPAPSFKATAVVDGEFRDVSLKDYNGKYVVLFFYPLDFTFVCPTEIIAFSDRAEEFRTIGCEVVACSTDSHFSHLAWVNQDRKEGGIGKMNIPILADKNMEISKAYGVLKEDSGIAYRGLFVIDGKQNLRQITINDLPVGRDVDETLRLVQAFQFTDEHGEVCPAGWKPGSKSMKADPKGSKDYFASEN